MALPEELSDLVFLIHDDPSNLDKVLVDFFWRLKVSEKRKTQLVVDVMSTVVVTRLHHGRTKTIGCSQALIETLLHHGATSFTFSRYRLLGAFVFLEDA